MTQTELVLWAGLAIGLIFGVAGQITGFCLHRGLKDYWTQRSGYQLQAFALALAVALVGTHIISALELITIQQSLYLSPSFSWFLLPLGGLMFGYGMGLSNGCGARALVLVAQGNLRSVLVLLSLGIAAYMTLSGVLAPLRIYLAQHTTLTLQTSTLSAGLSRSLVIAILAIALTLFAFLARGTGSRTKSLLGGLVVGLLIIAGWLTTGWLGADPFEPSPVSSLSFIAPIGDTLQYAMLATGFQLRFGIVLVLGVVLGSFLTALLRRQHRLQGFDSAPQMANYLLGGTLMGIGGVLALGCSIGQGLTGLSTLSYSSMIAVFFICLGMRLTVKTST